MREAALPADDLRLDDRAVEGGEEVDEVGPKALGNLVVGEAREAPGRVGRRRDRERAARFSPIADSQCIARVEHDSERALRRCESVDVVPRRRSGLVREEAAEDVRAVRNRRKGVGRLFGKAVDDRARGIGGRGHDRRASAKLSCGRRHDDAAVHRRHPLDPSVGARAVAEHGRNPVRQRRRAADDVRRKALAAVPHEMEVADPVARGESARARPRSA